MAGGVDLHTHTTCSDGTLAPRALVAEAIKRGVRVLAVTDHDSTDGLTEARLGTDTRYSEEALLDDLRGPASARSVITAATRLLTGFGDGVEDDTALLALGVRAIGVQAPGATSPVS